MRMKKTLVLLFALLLGAAAASPAMAIDWTAQGAINIMAALYKNIDERLPVYLGGPPGMNDFGFGVGPADPAWNRQNFWFQERSDIFITARASQDLYGVIGFEIASYRFGDADAKAINPNNNPGLGKDLAGRWNADAIAIQVKSMFIDVRVPKAPVWFRVGIQPFYVRPWVMLSDDGAGVSARIALQAGDFKIGINPFWAVIAAGTKTFSTATVPTDWTQADNQDLYGVDVNVSTGPVKAGMYFIYQARRQLYDTAGPPAGEGDSKQWWIGPYLDLKMGPLAATLDFVYNGGYEVWQGGQIGIFNIANPHSFPPAPSFQGYSRRHQGMLFRGETSYTMDKLRIGMGGLYGTGDDPTTLDKDEGFNVNFNGETAPVQRDFLIACGEWGLSVPFGATDNIIGFYKPWSSFGQGIWYVRGFADYQVNSWLKLLANAGYIGDTVKHGDEFGRDANDDQSIGWEIDVAAQIKIYRNLTFSSAFGYLIAGKALSMGDGVGQAGPVPGGFRPQDPWAWINTLSFVF
jgi:opacity protein-like surface antigen